MESIDEAITVNFMSRFKSATINNPGYRGRSFILGNLVLVERLIQTVIVMLATLNVTKKKATGPIGGAMETLMLAFGVKTDARD